MSADHEWAAARRRVAEFVAARDAYRARLDKARKMFGGSKNPMPNLICAQYGTLDVDDLRVLVGRSDSGSGVTR